MPAELTWEGHRPEHRCCGNCCYFRPHEEANTFDGFCVVRSYPTPSKNRTDDCGEWAWCKGPRLKFLSPVVAAEKAEEHE